MIDDVSDHSNESTSGAMAKRIAAPTFFLKKKVHSLFNSRR
jgi:hypothetical protein